VGQGAAVDITNDQITEYQVNVLVTFVLDD
jgi:hypothetical protein